MKHFDELHDNHIDQQPNYENAQPINSKGLCVYHRFGVRCTKWFLHKQIIFVKRKFLKPISGDQNFFIFSILGIVTLVQQ